MKIASPNCKPKVRWKTQQKNLRNPPRSADALFSHRSHPPFEPGSELERGGAMMQSQESTEGQPELRKLKTVTSEALLRMEVSAVQEPARSVAARAGAGDGVRQARGRQDPCRPQHRARVARGRMNRS